MNNKGKKGPLLFLFFMLLGAFSFWVADYTGLSWTNLWPKEQREQGPSQGSYAISSAEEKEILEHVQKLVSEKDPRSTLEAINYLEQKQLRQGFSGKLLDRLRALYLEQKDDSAWLLHCEKLAQAWFSSPKAKESSPDSQNTGLLPASHPVWRNKILTRFCLPALYHSGHWRDYIAVVRRGADPKRPTSADSVDFHKLQAGPRYLHAMLQLGRYRQGLQQCRDNVISIRDNPRSLELCADFSTKLKKWPLALKYLRRAYDKSPKAQLIRRMAQIHIKLQNYDKASALLRSIPRHQRQP